MSYGAASGAASGAAAAHASIANAVKASGAIVRIEPTEFQTILNKVQNPLIIYMKGGFLSAKHHYMVSYKGFVFHTKCNDILHLPSSAEVVQANKIWIPS